LVSRIAERRERITRQLFTIAHKVRDHVCYALRRENDTQSDRGIATNEEQCNGHHRNVLEAIMVMRRIVRFGFLVLTVSSVQAQNKPMVDKVPAIALPGKRTYVHYCISCHGVDAHGNGPAAIVLKTTPPDLTTLAKRHGGKFPYDYVSDVLKFGTRILSHGSSDMPIWGPIFGSLDNYDEVAVRKRIKDLSDYLASLQQKES
jgi:mono/diheme cytochrome c family protein